MSCMYLKCKKKLISISCILEQMYRLYFEINEAFIFYKDTLVCFAMLEDNLYKLKPTKENFALNIKIFRTVEIHNKRQKVSSNAYFWNLKLGHVNLNRIERLVKSGLLRHLEDNSFSLVNLVLKEK